MASFGSKHGVDDMVMLTKISEDTILDNLKKRYDNDIIYTYIGHVLIAMNPYKLIEKLYLERTLKDYRGKYQYEMPPHVYALADQMYRNMLQEGEDQCVIISGESGAGKTVTSKHIMQYIAAVTGHSPEVARVKDVILESNPLLEAFGNAKTIRNNNSSRFGKYMEIQFDLKGDPEGGRITNYLLEKSRVVFQAQSERNFHIFYQLLKGADGNLKSQLGLSGPDDYFFCNQGKSPTVDGIDDVQEYKDTLNAMNVVGVSPQEQQEILSLIAAILYIGNVHFADGGQDNAHVSNQQSIDSLAALLQTEPSSVQQALLFRTIQTGEVGRSKRVSTYACPQSVDGAMYSRDALAKALYSKLFDWIVEKVNSNLVVHNPDAFSIGVLDIYGFEIFQKNGFEQLCINYVNEKLQQIFIQLTLKAEQEEYAAEGIPWENIDYFNNKICCDLIESKRNPIGLLSLLDDVCNFPKGSDEKYLAKVGESYTQHAHLTMDGGINEFTVKHYAGDVTYCVEGFIDKNKDLLYNDLIDLTQCSRSQFIMNLFPEAREVQTKKRPTTAGFKIKTSIGLLVDTLSKCQPHYCRCIKPNEKKARNCFDSKLTLHQVRYLGLLENVRVRRAGFAYRQFYDKFFFRYRVCCDETWPSWSGSHQDGALAILRPMNLDAKEIAKGKTKLFVRHPETVFQLEELRERKVATYANRIQRFFLRFALRRYFWELQMAGNDAVAGKKERRRLSLERKFTGDYINYRENFALKKVVEREGGRDKIHFSDNITKYDRRSRRQRRIFLLGEQNVYIMSVEKNKDKDKAARLKHPFVYMCVRMVALNKIKELAVSPFQDNFVNMSVPGPGEFDQLFECRRKTELIGTMKKLNPSCNVTVSPSITSMIKGGKKRVITFAQNAAGGDMGKLKGKKVSVAPGLSKDSRPNLPEPKQMETQNIVPAERKAIQRKNPAPGGGAAAFSAPKPNSGGGGYSRPSPAAAPAPSYGGGGARPAPGGSRGRGGGGAGAGLNLVATALYAFNPENHDELSFNEGDTIIVIEKMEKDWWKGKCGGRVGVFPCSYVQVQGGGGGAPRGGAPRGGAPRGAAPRGRGGAPRGRGRGGAPRGRGGPPRGGVRMPY